MEDHDAVDESHYEISLTAGQAFVAFVLLLLSLAASFAFGLMLGKGQADDRLVVRKDAQVVSEAAMTPSKTGGRIVELGVNDDDFRPEPAAVRAAAPIIAEEPEAPSPDAPVEPADQSAIESQPAPAALTPASTSPDSAPAVPAVAYYAQLFSSSDQKAAEALATRLIDAGFLTAYVERGQTEKGAVFRVRVRFASEQDARAAESRLREFSKEVWITKR